MPDHVHFFCSPSDDISHELSHFMRRWKSWTSKKIGELGYSRPIWQPGFFDHLLRSNESYGQKWEYVRNNPVRAGFCTQADDWPRQGEVSDLCFL